jgi:flagellar basal-body rod modification protein FlgD
MSSAITNTPTTVSSSTNTTATNPNGQLQSQDFLKLLLTELQQQDPTSPMDTDKMLQQTSELSSLEAQNATKAAMTAMTSAFQASAGYNLTNAIGKMATFGDDTVSITGGKPVAFDVYLPTAAKSPTLFVTDGTGKIVDQIGLGDQPASIQSFKWDGTDGKGQVQPDGTYKVYISYYDTNGNPQTAKPGYLPVASVKFSTSGTPQLKVGSNYIDMSKITELSD